MNGESSVTYSSLPASQGYYTSPHHLRPMSGDGRGANERGSMSGTNAVASLGSGIIAGSSAFRVQYARPSSASSVSAVLSARGPDEGASHVMTGVGNAHSHLRSRPSIGLSPVPPTPTSANQAGSASAASTYMSNVSHGERTLATGLSFPASSKRFSFVEQDATEQGPSSLSTPSSRPVGSILSPPTGPLAANAAWATSGANLMNGDGVRLRPLEIPPSTISPTKGTQSSKVRTKDRPTSASSVASNETIQSVSSRNGRSKTSSRPEVASFGFASPVSHTDVANVSAVAGGDATGRAHVTRVDELEVLLLRVQFLEEQVTRLSKALKSSKEETETLRTELAQAKAKAAETEVRAEKAEEMLKEAYEKLASRAQLAPSPAVSIKEIDPENQANALSQGQSARSDRLQPAVRSIVSELDSSNQALTLSFVSALSSSQPLRQSQGLQNQDVNLMGGVNLSQDSVSVLSSLDQPQFSLSLMSPPRLAPGQFVSPASSPPQAPSVPKSALITLKRLPESEPGNDPIPDQGSIPLLADHPNQIGDNELDDKSIPDSASATKIGRQKTSGARRGKRPATAAKVLAALGLSHKVADLTQQAENTDSSTPQATKPPRPPSSRPKSKKTKRKPTMRRKPTNAEALDDFESGSDLEYPASDIEDEDGYIPGLDGSSSNLASYLPPTEGQPSPPRKPAPNVPKIGKLDLNLVSKLATNPADTDKARLLNQSLTGSTLLQSFEITADGTFKRGELAINATGLVWNSGSALKDNPSKGNIASLARVPRPATHAAAASFDRQGALSDASIVVSENDWVVGSEIHSSAPSEGQRTGSATDTAVNGSTFATEISGNSGSSGTMSTRVPSSSRSQTDSAKSSRFVRIGNVSHLKPMEAIDDSIVQTDSQHSDQADENSDMVPLLADQGDHEQNDPETKTQNQVTATTMSQRKQVRAIRSKESDLIMLNLLGRGSSATVYRAWSIPRNCLVAVKCVPIQERDKRQQLASELTAFRDLNSRHVTALYGCYLKDNSEVRMIFEYMPGGSLQDFVDANGPLNEESSIYVFEEALRGLAALQARGMVHRDIKPHNILLGRDMSVKLADFGMLSRGSKIKKQSLESESGEVTLQDEAPNEEEMCSTFVGTILYMAPERVFLKPYGYPSDVWALALSILTCFLGDYPLPDNADFSLMVRLEEEAKQGKHVHILDLPEVQALYPQLSLNPPSSSSLRLLSPEFLGILRRCLETDPKRRPTVRELLESEFFAQARLQRHIQWSATTDAAAQGFRSEDISPENYAQSFASHPPRHLVEQLNAYLEARGCVISPAQLSAVESNPTAKRKLLAAMEESRAKAQANDVSAAIQIVSTIKHVHPDTLTAADIGSISSELQIPKNSIARMWESEP